MKARMVPPAYSWVR